MGHLPAEIPNPVVFLCLFRHKKSMRSVSDSPPSGESTPPPLLCYILVVLRLCDARHSPIRCHWHLTFGVDFLGVVLEGLVKCRMIVMSLMYKDWRWRVR